MLKNSWVSTDGKVLGRASCRALESRRRTPGASPNTCGCRLITSGTRSENQAAAIAAYATRYNLHIVRTYKDEAISGLKIDKREGLKQLITDVCSGRADFSRVLVYDVSRWGRFQDVDESAHYEFVCRRAGIRVDYCAEQFDNDGNLLSSIVKNLKRVMAAEFWSLIRFRSAVSTGSVLRAGREAAVSGRPERSSDLIASLATSLADDRGLA